MGTQRTLSTHCRRGHPRTPENTYTYGNQRQCKDCIALRRTASEHKPRDKPRSPEETDKRAYAAGIFDGEGTIGVALHRKPGGSRRYHQLIIRVTSTDPRLTTWLQLHFGGRITEHRRETKENSSPAQTWRASATHAESFLRAVYPWLIVKRDQADLALLLRETAGKHGRASVVTQELFAYREGIRLGIQQLNRRRRLMPEKHVDEPIGA